MHGSSPPRPLGALYLTCGSAHHTGASGTFRTFHAPKPSPSGGPSTSSRSSKVSARARSTWRSSSTGSARTTCFSIEYCCLFGLAAARAPDLATLARFADLLQATARTEMDIHRARARDFGISEAELEREPMAPTTRAHTDFLVRVAAAGDSPSWPRRSCRACGASLLRCVKYAGVKRTPSSVWQAPLSTALECSWR
ncbi:MAG: hypothetical protein HY690_01320 [Chloroflexi bacterium]|nr:hypothetical protein [Chloroflexota bacterium]